MTPVRRRRFRNSPTHGGHSRRLSRRGVAVVEGAVMLSVMLLLLFVILDLGLAVARYNILAATAREVARAAIVRGSHASPTGPAWGPAPFTGTAADGSEIGQAAALGLAALPPAAVAVIVRWPDAGNREGDRVEVELRYFHAALPILGFGGGFDLSARSSMQIVY
jgi:hypothetical protein